MSKPGESMSHRLKRRDFLRAFMGTSCLAVESTSLGIAEATPREAGSASGPSWWIEPVERPVLEIDDDVYHRFDQHMNVLNAFRDYM